MGTSPFPLVEINISLLFGAGHEELPEQPKTNPRVTSNKKHVNISRIFFIMNSFYNIKELEFPPILNIFILISINNPTGSCSNPAGRTASFRTSTVKAFHLFVIRQRTIVTIVLLDTRVLKGDITQDVQPQIGVGNEIDLDISDQTRMDSSVFPYRTQTTTE